MGEKPKNSCWIAAWWFTRTQSAGHCLQGLSEQSTGETLVEPPFCSMLFPAINLHFIDDFSDIFL